MALAKIRKAILGAVIAGAGALTAAAQDGTVTSAEWLTVAGAVLLTGYGVWQIPNATGPKAVSARHDAGDIDIVMLLCGATLIGVILLLFGVTFR